MHLINSFCCVLVLGLIGLPALAADRDATVLTGQISRCAEMSNPASRLNCYDALNESLQADPADAADTDVAVQEVATATMPPESKAATVTQTPVVTTATSLPPAPPKPTKKTLLGNKADRSADEHLTLIKSEKDPFGRWRFYFDDGQVWRQTEKGYVSIPRKAAVPAILSTGVLGSYNLRLDGQKKKIKVTRIR